MQYMKQLDAIRAFGVITVIYLHYFGTKQGLLSICGFPIDFGITAVDAFFVLSGFLITGLLLKYKSKVDGGTRTVVSCLKEFYQRRTMRIFPIFYLSLLVAGILDITSVRDTIWWNLFYLSNVYMAQVGDWKLIHGITHLWSLAVEEQFYLSWPLIILLVPKKHLLKALLVIIASAPVYRYFCGIYHVNRVATAVMTNGNLDLLALGALLAYMKMHVADRLHAFTRYCLLIGIAGYLISVVASSIYPGGANAIFTRTFEGMFTCWFVNKAADGFGGIFGRVMAFKPLLHIGKISYGLYLYHFFIPNITPILMHHLNLPMPGSLASTSLLNATVTILVASLSWYFIELPISSQKNKKELSPAIQKDRKSLSPNLVPRQL
jgi:peptidoglycan/LPS O-acetylase OafA/YrhL